MRLSPARQGWPVAKCRDLRCRARRLDLRGLASVARRATGLTMNTYTHVLLEIERAAIDAAARTIFE